MYGQGDISSKLRYKFLKKCETCTKTKHVKTPIQNKLYFQKHVFLCVLLFEHQFYVLHFNILIS